MAFPEGSYASYPAPPGDKPWGVRQVSGPASYAVIVVATPPTGGIAVTARDLGFREIEWCSTGMSDNGQYILLPMPAASIVRPQTTVRFMAVTAATGAEVVATTDISARKFNILVLGN